jgi:phage shock protein PspC (stress-responsive transcriptional regulator)
MKTPPREDGALLAGVCSGIARAFGWNAWVLRGLFVLFLLVKTLWAVVAYAVLALAFHFGREYREQRHGSPGLESPELSERNRRIEELERRFRDLEQE